jgi:hypothetical protein
MSNISDLRASRETASQRRLAASKESYEALIDLMALDAATATLGGEPAPFRIEQEGLRVTDMDEASSRYHVPYQYYPANSNWIADIEARRDAYIKENRQ